MSKGLLISARVALAGLISFAALAAAQTRGVGPDQDPDIALARTAALSWLAKADAGKIEETWDEAATTFQKAQKKPEWVRSLSTSRPALGPLISRRFLNHEIRDTLPDLPRGKYITIRFSTVFGKHKDGAESVTLIKDGARGFRMMGYYLQ